MLVNRDNIRQQFADYTSAYNAEDPKIKLKIYHTYRVADIGERIAASLNMNDEDKDLAWTCGMLHDIGRFEQLRRYNTFADSQSIDHAKFGVELLFGDERLIDRFFPEGCPGDFLDIVREAIYYHSAYRLPEDMDERTLTFAQILRDADKVDIFRVNIETPAEEIYNVTTEELMNSKVTPEVMEAYSEEHCILRNLKKTPVDNLVGHMSLVFELVYPESLRITQEQGYHDRLMNFKSANPETNEQLKTLREIMKDYYERKQHNR